MKFIRKFIKNSRGKKNGNFFLELKQLLGFAPIDLVYYEKAFTHRSLNKKDEVNNPFNYERLEFLGDSMLDTVISYYLYDRAPHGDEGYLTKMRSKIVSREHLNELGKELNLIHFLKTKLAKGNFGDNIHGNVFESLIGAIFLDKGYKFCEQFIYDKVILPHVNLEQLESKITSYKSLLIEWCQKKKKSFDYNVYDDTGNESVTHFSVRLSIDGKLISKARATSKKKAEEKASKRAYFVLESKINN